MYLNGLFD